MISDECIWCSKFLRWDYCFLQNKKSFAFWRAFIRRAQDRSLCGLSTFLTPIRFIVHYNILLSSRNYWNAMDPRVSLISPLCPHRERTNMTWSFSQDLDWLNALQNRKPNYVLKTWKPSSSSRVFQQQLALIFITMFISFSWAEWISNAVTVFGFLCFCSWRHMRRMYCVLRVFGGDNLFEMYHSC